MSLLLATAAAAAGAGGFWFWQKRRKRQAVRKKPSASRPTAGAQPSDAARTALDPSVTNWTMGAIQGWLANRAALDDDPLQGAALGVKIGARFGPIGAVIGAVVGLFVGAASRILGQQTRIRSVRGKMRALAREYLDKHSLPETDANIAFFIHAQTLLNLPASWQVGFRGSDLFVRYPPPSRGRDKWKQWVNTWLWDPCRWHAGIHEQGEKKTAREQQTVEGLPFGDAGFRTYTWYAPKPGIYRLRPAETLIEFYPRNEPQEKAVDEAGIMADTRVVDRPDITWGHPSQLGNLLIAHLARCEHTWGVDGTE